MTITQQPPGVDVPNVTPLSEWRVRLNGAIATCVEAASTVLLGVYHLAVITGSIPPQGLEILRLILRREVPIESSQAPSRFRDWNLTKSWRSVSPGIVISGSIPLEGLEPKQVRSRHIGAEAHNSVYGRRYPPVEGFRRLLGHGMPHHTRRHDF